MKKNLLTIGDMSKRTGCSIKSLRYYDSIGVLKPAYIDKKTNYRYYTFEQTRIAEMLQICVLLGINLKDVKKLYLKEDNTMNYSDLITYGKKITKEKILKLQEDLNFLNTFQDEIDRISSYDNEEEREFNITEKYYITLPFDEDEINNNYYNLLNTLFNDCINRNLLIKNDYGVVINMNNNEEKNL